MNRILLGAVAALVVLPVVQAQNAQRPPGGRPAAAAQGTRTFTARLAPVPRDAAMMASITGGGSVSAVLTGTKLSITGSFDGLQTPATLARIHKGSKAGVRGDAVLDLQVSRGTSGTISGTFDLTPAQVADLEQGRLYVQIHSEKAPDGNLWGWLLSQESRR
jgi:hypothetical protein